MKNFVSLSRHHEPLQRAWYCMAAGSSQHTLSVKNKIEKTKEKALLGGGQNRIDKQHQKVRQMHGDIFN